ncbi:MAG: TRAP transporter small permease subunit, partial [Parafilimonas terrae]|nr:TRAP transporter small permease subunit [Parafilimonas terrae]
MQLDAQLDLTLPSASLETAAGPSRLRAFDRALGRMIEIPAAILVGLEIVVLLAGVVSRYLLHRPLVWSDELASILFLWLAMLGTVIAYRRGEHMRMTAFVGMASPRARAFLETLAIVSGLVLVGLLLEPAVEFAIEESWVHTPALDLANTWRAAALPVGFALMLATAVVRLVQESDWRLTGAALLLGGCAAAGLAVLSPTLIGLGNLNLMVFFVLGVGALVFSGVPIAFAFGLATYAYLMTTTHAPAMVVVGRMDEGMSHLILLAVPLFVFLGLLIEMTGMARAMVGFLASLLGHVRGGLHYVLVGAMYLVSGISGSK